ncbi:hypothetical protein [uncultured Tateyamaria sp.]|uniref:hypothetical protein n=1 Tax=uncultured Tateyamaria sp. TaxID=455651 RepID=UPI00261057C5|nr:hypothetical protein [uncultured Tateyamaria sp.]
MDVDTFDRTLGGEVGDGQAALLADWPTTPAALRDQDGNWFAVKSAVGGDTLRVFTVFLIRRWAGDPPTIVQAV